MSKRNNKRNNRSGVEVLSGQYLLTQSIGSGAPSSLLVNPSVFPRANTVSAVYQNYRFKRVRIHMLPINVTSAGNFEWVLGFCSDVSATVSSLTGNSSVSECTPSAIQYNSGTNNLNYGSGYGEHILNLGPKQLIRDGSLKWWKCVGDSDTNNWENYQFMLVFYNNIAATQVYRMWVHYTVEFSSPISSLLTLGRVLPKDETSTENAEISVDFKSHPDGCQCHFCPAWLQSQRKRGPK
jgi:hypothetical protein